MGREASRRLRDLCGDVNTTERGRDRRIQDDRPCDEGFSPKPQRNRTQQQELTNWLIRETSCPGSTPGRPACTTFWDGFGAFVTCTIPLRKLCSPDRESLQTSAGV
jgi:hypothetical protein